MKKLKNNIPVPLYYQLREIIRDKIISEEWEYGREIPSELKLCDEFNLCRATVKQALDGLVNEGLIVRQKGRGSFVIYQKSAENFLLEPSFNKKSGGKGVNDYMKVLSAEFTEAQNRIYKLLKLEENIEICQIERVHFMEKEPVAIDRHYISPKWAGNILKEDLGEIAIYKYIENTCGESFSDYQVRVKSQLLDDYEKAQFHFPIGGTGLVVECLSFIGEIPVMFNRRMYRGDRCDLCLDFAAFNQKLEMKGSEVLIGEKKKKA